MTADKDVTSDKAGGEKKDGAASTWASDLFGVYSVFDLKANRAGENKPVPIPTYLEESILGLRHGPGDPRARSKRQGGGSGSDSDRPVSRGLKTEPAQLVELMRQMSQTEVAVATGNTLFWLVTGAIFGTLPAMVLDEFRSLLGRQWQDFCLGVAGRCHDHEARDWVLAAVPCVYGQAFYRMYCDGFHEDRKNFLTYTKNFINKIVLVIHFELTGFQLNVDSVRRLRRIFIPRVLTSPHQNQHDYIKGQRRQQELESNQATVSGPRPLKFGFLDAPQPDEVQLEHVLQARADAIAQALQSMGRLSTVGKSGPVPQELSVDRYANLSGTGVALLDKHLNEIFAGVDEAEEAEGPTTEAESEAEEDRPGMGRNADSPPDSASPSPPESPVAAGSQHSWTSPRDSDGETEPSRPHTVASEVNTQSAQFKKKARLKKAKMVGTMALMRIKANEKREEEAKLKRQRLEDLQAQLASEKLPPELCRKELNTTWVSPPMKTLHVDAINRQQILHKPRAENFDLKMAAHMARPLSMPALRSRDGGAAKASDAVTVASQKDDGSMPANRERRISNAGDTKGPGSSTAGGGGALGGRSGLNMSSSGILPRLGSETLALEPPSTLSGKVIDARMDKSSKAAKSHSFALYLKEYDVFSGIKKQRLPAKGLRDEENAYLKKMNGLIGGDPKRRLYPGGAKGPRDKSSSFRMPS